MEEPTRNTGPIVFTMRRVLTDYARRRRACKRPDGRRRVDLQKRNRAPVATAPVLTFMLAAGSFAAVEVVDAAAEELAANKHKSEQMQGEIRSARQRLWELRQEVRTANTERAGSLALSVLATAERERAHRKARKAGEKASAAEEALSVADTRATRALELHKKASQRADRLDASLRSANKRLRQVQERAAQAHQALERAAQRAEQAEARAKRAEDFARSLIKRPVGGSGRDELVRVGRRLPGH